MLQNHRWYSILAICGVFQKYSQEGLKGTIPEIPSFYFKETWTILYLPSLCVVLPSWKTLEKLWAQNISSEAAPLPFFKNSFPLPPPCPPLTPPPPPSPSTPLPSYTPPPLAARRRSAAAAFQTSAQAGAAARLFLTHRRSQLEQSGVETQRSHSTELANLALIATGFCRVSETGSISQSTFATCLHCSGASQNYER